MSPELTALGSPGATPSSARTRYKQAMEQAQSAAKAMQEERREADAD